MGKLAFVLIMAVIVLAIQMPLAAQEEPTCPPCPCGQPTPTSTPVPGGGDVVVKSIMPITSFLGSLYFIGEIENSTTIDVSDARVIVSLFDEEKQIVGTESGSSKLDLISAGGKAPFEIVFFSPPAFQNFEAVLEYEEPSRYLTASIYRDWIILTPRERIRTDFIKYEIVGQIQNIGQETAEYVEVIGTLYDANGKVVAVQSTYTELETVPPDGIAPFSLEFSTVAGEVASYALVVEGRVKD